MKAWDEFFHDVIRGNRVESSEEIWERDEGGWRVIWEERRWKGVEILGG